MTTVDSLDIQISAQVSRASANIDNLVGKLNTLSSSLNKINGSGLTGLANGVNRLSAAMQSMKSVGTADFTRLAKNIQKLGNINVASLNSAASSMSHLTRAFNQLGGVSTNAQQVGVLANNLSKLGYKSINNAITNLPALTSGLNNLMTTLSHAPKVSNNVIQMTNTLANLASQGGRVGTASRTLVNGLNNSTNAMNRASKNSRSLAGAFGKFYANFFWMVRGTKSLWKSVESSMDYVEVLNYFDAAFTQVAEKADYSRFMEIGEKAGEEAAKEYADSFAKRAKELTSQMTGFAVTEKGTLEATGMPSLGMDPSQLMQYQAMFGQMASSMGVASETSLKLSRALTEIGADLASVKNMDFDKVWTDMASGLAGMSRTLDKYGVNIRNVNLQQKLTELGINANITALNQNDKALLRTIILLDSTRYAWGDLADTINQPANQLRLIEANFQNLGRTIGNLFLPIVQKVLPYINGMTIALQRLFVWVGNLLGVDLSKVTTSVGDTDFGDIIDGADDLTDGLNGAVKAAEKLRTITLGIDELNINAPQEEGAGTGAGAGLTGGLLDGAFEKALSEYQEAWDEAFANMENRAQELADKVEKFFEPIKKIIQDFAVGDFFQAGKDVSNLVVSITDFFARAIDNVDWYGIGKSIGDFLAGIDWIRILKSTGKLIWKALKAVLKLWKGAFDAAPIETGLLTAISVLKFTKLGSILRAVLLPKINDALDKASSGLNLQKLATGIAAVFGEFALISDAFEGLVSGAQGVGSALGEIVAGAGLAAGALKLIGLSNPWTAVIVGITGVVGAFKGMSDAQQEALEKFAEEQELAVFGEKVSDITNRIEQSANTIRDRIQASNEYVQTAGIAETQMAQDLAEKYFDLYEKENLTNEETEEMQRLAGLLIEKFPDLQQYYDDQTGLIDTTRQSVEQLIEQRLKEIQLNAVEEQLTEAYKTRVDALTDLGGAAEDVQKAQEELTRLQNEYNDAVAKQNAAIAYEKIGELLSVGIDSMEDFSASQELLNNLSAAGIDATGELSDIYQQLWNIITSGGTEEIPSFKNLGEKIDDTELEIELLSQDYQDLLKGFSESEGAYKEAEENIENLSKMMSEGMQGVGGDFGDGYEEGILSKVREVKDAGKELAKSGIVAVQETNDSHSPSIVAMGLGKDFVDGYNIGISENAESSVQKITEWATKILEAAKAALGIGETTGESTSMFGGILENFVPSWELFAGAWTERLENWKLSNDELYFGEAVWSTNWMNLYNTYVEMWSQFTKLWKTNFDNWWKIQIVPFFSVEKWTEFGANMKGGIYSGFKGIVNGIGTALNGIITVFDEAFARLESSMNGLINDYNSLAEIMGTPSIGNVSYEMMGKIEIPQYQMGGFPEDGLFFANHNELVGEFSNGRTAVANNEMIVAGIEEAAYRGMMRALQESGNASLLADIAENTRAAADREIVARIDPTRETVSALRGAEKRYGFQFT